MAGSETPFFEKKVTLLSIGSLENNHGSFSKLPIDRSVTFFSKTGVSEPATIARKLLVIYSPGPGNFGGTWLYHCRKKCVFHVFKIDFEN